MMKAHPALLLALLLAILVAACTGGDDDPTATVAAGDDTQPATIEATMAAITATTDASPEPDETSDSTATVEPSGSPEPGEFTDEEAALLDLLLAAGDLPGEWNQLRVEAPALSESPGICDAPRFPRAAERIAEVEVEYQSAEGDRFVLQDVTEFPEDVAVEAMAYIRETAICSAWTDETGTVFQISPAEAPELGDEAHAIHIAFQVADAGRLEGDFTFVRLDGFVTIVTTLEVGGYDPAFTSEITRLAAAKIDALVGTGRNVTDEESALIAGLLTLDDLGDDWDQPQPPHRSEPGSWTGLCGAEIFPGAAEAIARVGTEFYEGFEPDSATLMQLLVRYPAGVTEAAFDYELEAASCGSFSGGNTDVTLERDEAFPALGDESFAFRFTFDNDDNVVEGYWTVIRVGDALTTLIYTDPSELEDGDAYELAETATDRIAAAAR